MVIPEGLTLSAVTKRENPYDVLMSRTGAGLRDLPTGARVGTSSLRRQIQIRRVRPDLRIEMLRGNVDTRMRKLREGIYDAVVLAYAGVKRMGYEEEIAEVLRDFIPAVGQGSLAIETREDDSRVRELVKPLDHRESRLRAECERAFLRRLEGGCQVPIGAYAEISGNRISLRGFISDLEGSNFIEGSEEGNVEQAREVGERLAEKLLERGGREILREIYGG